MTISLIKDCQHNWVTINENIPDYEATFCNRCYTDKPPEQPKEVVETTYADAYDPNGKACRVTLTEDQDRIFYLSHGYQFTLRPHNRGEVPTITHDDWVRSESVRLMGIVKDNISEQVTLETIKRDHPHISNNGCTGCAGCNGQDAYDDDEWFNTIKISRRRLRDVIDVLESILNDGEDD